MAEPALSVDLNSPLRTWVGPLLSSLRVQPSHIGSSNAQNAAPAPVALHCSPPPSPKDNFRGGWGERPAQSLHLKGRRAPSKLEPAANFRVSQTLGFCPRASSWVPLQRPQFLTCILSRPFYLLLQVLQTLAGHGWGICEVVKGAAATLGLTHRGGDLSTSSGF